MTFGTRLKEARIKSGLSQKELARLACVKDNSISNWENGKNIPSASVVITLARALGVSLQDIVGFHDMNEVIAIGEKPSEERTREERLIYSVFHEYASDIGRGLSAANGIDGFSQILDEILSEHDNISSPEEAASLRSELRGIMSGYNSLSAEGKDYVKQSLKIALAAYSKDKGEE